MRAVLDRIARLGRYAWSGWAGLTGLFCFVAVWQAGYEAYGSFILPSPLETTHALGLIAADPKSPAIVGATVARSLIGFAISVSIGTFSGIAAGYSHAAIRAVRPIVTVLLGVPPIAWIVLALIWFGSSGGTAVMTVVVAALPLSFAAAAEGVATRPRDLDAMARSLGAGILRRFFTVVQPHLASHLFPAWTATLGMAFKVAIMAELLSNAGGIGGALAISRANLDISEAMAWVVIAVMLVLLFDFGVLHPLRDQLERWRDAGLPWGVKR